MTDKPKLIITSALPYVNNVLHLGNIIGSVLSADVYARYMKVFHPEYDTIFVGGVDEYGTATEMKARELGISCKELCDKNNALHSEINKWFQIDFDAYGRTSQPNGNPEIIDDSWPQTQITHQIFKSLCAAGYIIEKEDPVLFCPKINAYVADRFVIGICPVCKYDKCSGDQCDQCQKLISPEEIIEPKYKLNPSYALELRFTYNLYIDTNKVWQDKNMTQWFESQKSKWTTTANGITEVWLGMGLKPRSITRDLKWGTRVPDTPEFGSKYKDKVFYVWFDAPIGYISISELVLGKEKSESFWKSENTKLVQFMAKDNVQFHSVIFPVTLRGSGYSNIMDVNISAIEYLMYEGQKFSKTNNTGLFADDVIRISKKYDISSDLFRAYLISIRPETSDSNFVLNGENGMVDFVNNVMIKNIGNLIHRISSVAYQIHINHKIDHIVTNNGKEHALLYDSKENQDILTEYHNYMNQCKLREGFNIVLKYSSHINKYVNETAPWKLVKDDKCKEDLYLHFGVICTKIITLSNILRPFMPSLSLEIDKQYSLAEHLPYEKPVVMIKQLGKIDI